jgi:hypothetical protein
MSPREFLLPIGAISVASPTKTKTVPYEIAQLHLQVFFVGFWLTRSLAGYSRDESEGEGPRLLRLAEHLKFGSPGESAKHFLAFRPRARGYVSGVSVSDGREMILPSDLLI